MRGAPRRALVRLVINLLLVSTLTLVGGAAYASQSVTELPVAALTRQQGQLAHPAPAATPVSPITTVVAASAFDQLRSDLETIAAQSGARVGISLEELSGPRRNSYSLNGSQSFYAASAYK